MIVLRRRGVHRFRGTPRAKLEGPLRRSERTGSPASLPGVRCSDLSAIAMALPRWEIASLKAERRKASSPALPHHSIAISSAPAAVK